MTLRIVGVTMPSSRDSWSSDSEKDRFILRPCQNVPRSPHRCPLTDAGRGPSRAAPGRRSKIGESVPELEVANRAPSGRSRTVGPTLDFCAHRSSESPSESSATRVCCEIGSAALVAGGRVRARIAFAWLHTVRPDLRKQIRQEARTMAVYSTIPARSQSLPSPLAPGLLKGVAKRLTSTLLRPDPVFPWCAARHELLTNSTVAELVAVRPSTALPSRCRWSAAPHARGGEKRPPALRLTAPLSTATFPGGRTLEGGRGVQERGARREAKGREPGPCQGKRRQDRGVLLSTAVGRTLEGQAEVRQTLPLPRTSRSPGPHFPYAPRGRDRSTAGRDVAISAPGIAIGARRFCFSLVCYLMSFSKLKVQIFASICGRTPGTCRCKRVRFDRSTRCTSTSAAAKFQLVDRPCRRGSLTIELTDGLLIAIRRDCALLLGALRLPT